jgi:RNA polymerase sigma factor (sigma-70 family)
MDKPLNGNGNGYRRGEAYFFDPGGNLQLEALVSLYKKLHFVPEDRERLFREIVVEVIPLIEWLSLKSGWLASVGESQLEAIVSEFVLKLPKILDSYKPDNGSKFFSYLTASIGNTFQKWLRKKRNADKYRGDWPTDEEGNYLDLEDSQSSFVSNESVQKRAAEFEQLMFMIPNEIGEGLPHKNLMRYVARRYLDMADNGEQLYISELSAEVAKLPCHSLDPKSIENLVRATIAGVRAKLYEFRLRVESEHARREEALEVLRGLLERGDPKLWPLLLVLEPWQTVMLLDCMAGILPSCPPRARWYRRVPIVVVNGETGLQPRLNHVHNQPVTVIK